MKIIGITGSMATGKSELLRQIHSILRWPIWDADAEVQKLYLNPHIIQGIATAFPNNIKTSDGKAIDRPKLRQQVIVEPTALHSLENILYPSLISHRTSFIQSMRRLNEPVIVLDIPLLFEKGMNDLCDVTVVTSCPPWLQQHRILSRSGMTPNLMHHLLSHQISLETKKRMADIIVETGLNRRHSWNSFLQQIKEKICAR